MTVDMNVEKRLHRWMEATRDPRGFLDLGQGFADPDK